MSAANTESIKPIQEALLVIYSIVVEMCKRHGLRYWATGGTLLGAERHRGFIPWDDDIDIVMPRADYNKFINIAQKELPSNLKILSLETHKDYTEGFAKVQNIDAEWLEKVESQAGLYLGQGLFVDVFPLDGCPGGFVGRVILRCKIFLAKARLRYAFGRSKPSTVRGWMFYLAGMIPWGIVPRFKTQREYAQWITEIAVSRPFDESKRCGLVVFGSPYQMNFETSWYAKTVMLQFETMQMPCPMGFDLILRKTFGDYHRLPPEEMRKPAHLKIERASIWRLGN